VAKDLLRSPGRRCRLAKQSIDGCPTDLEMLGDVRCTKALISGDSYLLWVDARLARLLQIRHLMTLGCRHGSGPEPD
jgi:hypothetical protein